MRHFATLVAVSLVSCPFACSSTEDDSDENDGGAAAVGAATSAGQSVGGAAGGPPVVGAQSIGDVFPEIDTVELDFNIDDGFFEYNNETYVLDVASGHVAYQHSDGTEASGDATADQLAALLAGVRGAVFREQAHCIGLAIDGGSYPPQITVTGSDREEQYRVSDTDCAESDHSAFGLVISCDAYRQIHELFLEIVPGGHEPGCIGYW